MSAPWRETPNVEWTDERPTEPGEYWLSFHPDNRNRFRSMPAVVAASVIERKDSLYALWGDVIRTPQVMLDLNDSRLLDGALWSVRETPADPFAKQETMIRTIKGPCFDCDEECACAQYVFMCHCHFRDGEITDEIPKVESNPKHEPRPNVPPRMM